MQILMRALSSPPFGNYHVWWSLADTKYAGTALLVKKCLRPLKVSFSLDGTGIFVCKHLFFKFLVGKIFHTGLHLKQWTFRIGIRLKRKKNPLFYAFLHLRKIFNILSIFNLHVCVWIWIYAHLLVVLVTVHWDNIL